MKDFPLYRSVPSCVTATLLIAAPLLLLALSPLSGLYAVLLVALILPAAACMAGLIAGLIPMVLGAAAGLISMYLLLGQWGLVLSAVYVVPILIAFAAVVALRVPFWRGCGVLVGVHLLSFLAVYVLLQRLAGGDFYAWAGEQAMTALSQWDMGDAMLYQLYAMGLLNLTNELAEGALQHVQGGYMLSAAARKDLLLSVNTMVTSNLQSLVPSLIVSQSLLGGVSCLLLPLRFGFLAEEKRAFLREAPSEARAEEGPQKVDFPDLGMPPLSLWHIPEGMGWQVGVALVLGYILRITEPPALRVAGIILYAAASNIFVIQGAALVNYLQKMRGVRRGWRVAVPLLLLTTSLLMIIGIFDQISNIRRLRKPRLPKEDDFE